MKIKNYLHNHQILYFQNAIEILCHVPRKLSQQSIMEISINSPLYTVS